MTQQRRSSEAKKTTKKKKEAASIFFLFLEAQSNQGPSVTLTQGPGCSEITLGLLQNCKIHEHVGNHNDTHLNVSGPKTKEAVIANLHRQKAAAPNPSQGLHLKRKVTPAQNPLPVKKNPPASLVHDKI